MKFINKGWVSLLLLGSMVPANATIARLQALGMDETDNEGSYYIEDNRNIFLNAGNIHKYANSLVLEWGAVGNEVPTAGTSSQLATDELARPKAKGGFLKSHGDWTYGLYFGNESNTSSLLRALATGAAAAAQTGATSGATNNMLDGSDNQLDFFFGSKTSMFDWGVNLVYTADDNDAAKQEDHGYAAKLGLVGDRWDGFVNLSVGSNSKRTDTLGSVGTVTAGTQIAHEFDGKFGIHVGGGYEIQKGMKVYAMAKKFDWDQIDSVGSYGSTQGQQGTVEGGFLTYAVGMGRTHDFGDSKLFVNAEYRSTSIEVKFTNKAEAQNVELPLTLGYEVKATEWLTFRGSVRQFLYGYKKNNNYSSLNVIGKGFADTVFGTDTGNQKVTFDNTTDVNAGMSLTFGRLVFDGLIGFSGTNGSATGTESGVFASDRLMSRVGATYSF
jgi:hypothetical protein